MVTINNNGVLTTFYHFSDGSLFAHTTFETQLDKKKRFLKINSKHNYKKLPAMPVWAFNSESRNKFSRVRALYRVILREHLESINRGLVNAKLDSVASK